MKQVFMPVTAVFADKDRFCQNGLELPFLPFLTVSARYFETPTHELSMKYP